MRRIASAIGPVLALLAISAPTTPAHSAVPFTDVARLQVAPAAPRTTTADASASLDRISERTTHRTSSRTASRGIALDTASSSLGTSYVNVSWNWIKAASGYNVQISRQKDFSKITSSRSKGNSSHRPAGGRLATVVGSLRDATYYWVRVRKTKGARASAWSAPVRVATKAHIPAAMFDVRGVAGPVPGSTKLRWQSDGAYTDYFRITTALTPFGSAHTPAVGHNSMTFRAPGNSQGLVLTPDQVAAAGAGLGTGRHLFFRVTSVRAGDADTASRPYGKLLSTTIAGEASTGTGPQLRVAQYNMHIQSKDIPGHLWKDRAPLIAANIASVDPDVVTLQELLPPMWTNEAGGIGLQAALRQAGLGSYRLVRETAFAPKVPGDSRILYNPAVVQLVSNCSVDATDQECLIPVPSGDNIGRFAAYAEFRDIASGQLFYVVGTHLTPGACADTDTLRGSQVAAITQFMANLNTDNLPVIFGGDFNSSQTGCPADTPHDVALNAGYYNTIAAANQVNTDYNSVNAYTTNEHASPYGFGSMIDTIMTLNMPGADLWKLVRTTGPWPSDHNMIFTDVRLP